MGEEPLFRVLDKYDNKKGEAMKNMSNHKNSERPLSEGLARAL